MREILFRGRRIDGTGWAEGLPMLMDGPEITRIAWWNKEDNRVHFAEIDPSTLCQFTGLRDKNGARIWEGDILKWTRKDTVLCETNYQRNPYGYGDILVVRSFASGYTLTTMTNNSDIPNIVGNIGNYNLWNYQRAFIIIGSIHDKEQS